MSANGGQSSQLKPGTNYCHRSRMQTAERVILTELASATVIIEPHHRCTGCGHAAQDHDLDRTVLLGDQRPGGEGCLLGWDEDIEGCDCAEFRPTSGALFN